MRSVGISDRSKVVLDIKERSLVILLLLLLLLLGEGIVAWTCFVCQNGSTNIRISISTKQKNRKFWKGYLKNKEGRRTSKHQHSQKYPAHPLYQQTKQPDFHSRHPSSWQRKVSVLDSLVGYLAFEKKKVQEKTITRTDGKENVFRMYLGDWRREKVFVVVFDWMEKLKVTSKARRGCSFCQVK